MIGVDRFRGLSLAQATDLLKKDASTWNEGNPWLAESAREFDLRKGLGMWKAIGANRSVLSWIAYGVPMRFQSVPPRTSFPSPQVNEKSHQEFLDKEVKTHLADGLFKIIDPAAAHIVHPVRVIQQGQKLRRIDDMRFQNGFQASPKFKMASLEHDVKNIIQPDDVLLTKDLAKAYYKINVEKKAQPFQCFEWKEKLVCALVMLFGWCKAPFFFTKICRPITTLFGALMIRVMNFIDDFLFSEKAKKMKDLSDFIEFVLLNLGWSFNEKSEDGTRVKFLGYVLDSSLRSFEVPSIKIEKAQDLISKLLLSSEHRGTMPSSVLQSLLGALNSFRLAIPAVSVWTRELYSPWKSVELNLFPGQSVTATPLMIEELLVLGRLLESDNSAPFMDAVSELDAFVDTGEIGWGGSVLLLQVRGLLDVSLIGSSSTRRELTGLSSFVSHPLVLPLIRGKKVRFTMDSKAALANLINGGGPVPALCLAVKTLWIFFQTSWNFSFFSLVSKRQGRNAACRCPVEISLFPAPPTGLPQPTIAVVKGCFCG